MNSEFPILLNATGLILITAGIVKLLLESSIIVKNKSEKIVHDNISQLIDERIYKTICREVVDIDQSNIDSQWKLDRMRLPYQNFPKLNKLTDHQNEKNIAEYIDNNMKWAIPYLCQTFPNTIWAHVFNHLIDKDEYREYVLTNNPDKYFVEYIDDDSVNIYLEFVQYYEKSMKPVLKYTFKCYVSQHSPNNLLVDL